MALRRQSLVLSALLAPVTIFLGIFFLVPLLTIAALDAGALVSGALITETIFARPGMGKLIYDAVMGNDFNLALLALLVVAIMTMLATLAADLAQRWLDPRIA